MTDYSKDLELWTQWNKTKSPLDLEKLIKQLNPILQAEVNKWVGTLAREALEGQARILAVKAVKSFDPKRGVKLSTHVTNQIQKLSRVVYAHQNAARIPEHSMLQYGSFMSAKEDFKTEFGRDPTSDELADTLKWSPAKVERFQTEFGRSELLESKESPADLFVPYTHNPMVDYAYFSMSPRQQKIWEFTTGYRGSPRLSNTEIMKKLGITQGVLSYEKNKISKMLQGLM